MQYTRYMAGTATEFLYKVYGWMGIALAISASVAYYVAHTPTVFKAIYTPGILIALVLGQLALVIFLSFLLNRMNFATAILAYLLYAVLSGVTLSSIFMVYQLGSIFSTFVVAAGMFVAMGIYGYFTKQDLSSMSSLLMMGLVGLIIGFLVNMFLRSPGFDYVLSGIGVIIFSLLTAFDIQKIKQFGQTMYAQGEEAGKVAILGALSLYLDFINLFLYLLRFMGQRKE